MSLTDRIKQLPTTNAGVNIHLAQALEVVANAVPVEVDTERHTREPQDEGERISWAALDTTWNILREYAVRSVLQDIRDQAAEQGIELPTDEQLFEEGRKSGNPDAPTSYLDLAPNTRAAAEHLATAFGLLFDETMQDAGGGADEL